MHGLSMWVVHSVLAVFCLGITLLFIPVKAEATDKEKWLSYIEEVCEERNICPELVEAIIERESSWRPDVRNGECVGLMQINPKYQEERLEKFGLVAADLADPYDNILVGTDYLLELFEKYEDVYAVLMFYNAGYSQKYGLGAWEDGRYSNYAVEVSERSAELERMNGK